MPVERIELSSPEWRSGVLPLNDTGKEPHPGFEPGHSALPRRRLSTEACAAFGRRRNRTADFQLAGLAPSRLGYAPLWNEGESNSHLRHAKPASSRWTITPLEPLRIELRSRVCQTRVLPLHHGPERGTNLLPWFVRHIAVTSSRYQKPHSR